MKILITNDDGINASGIIRLAEVAKKFGEVWVVAPDGQRSAMSHSITLRTYIDVYPDKTFPVEGVHAYKCSGTPGDCVRVGVLNIVPGKPDVVFSGINYGYNLASDIQYSATAGAAFEAAFQGVHTIAFSEGMSECHEVTDRYLEEIIAELIDKKLEEGQIWNVNFPDCKLDEFKGILRNRIVSRQAFFSDSYTEERLENEGIRFMVNGKYTGAGEEGTDFGAVINNYVSIGVVSNIQ